MMERSLLKTIHKTLLNCSYGNSYVDLIASKFDIQQYNDWRETMVGVEIGGNKFVSESTGQNICYTAFSTSVSENEKTKVVDDYYIQKSLLGDFFSFYVKSRVFVKHSKGNVIYPNTIIVSPELDYSTFFHEAYDLVEKIYNKPMIIPFYILEMEVDVDIDFFNNVTPNYYEALFGYEGNILENPIVGDKYYRFSK